MTFEHQSKTLLWLELQTDYDLENRQTHNWRTDRQADAGAA